MTITVGPRLHFRGSRPRSPGPRVTIGRMYPSTMLFRRHVWRMISENSSGVCGILRSIAFADWYIRSTWRSSLNTRLLYARMPSNTPSPYRRPWSFTGILASDSGKNFPSRYTTFSIGEAPNICDMGRARYSPCPRGAEHCLAEPLPGQTFEQRNVEIAGLFQDIVRKRRDVGLRLSSLSRRRETVMVADLAVVLPDELLAQLHLLALLVRGEVPEPVLVCGAERVDEHQPSLRVHRDLLLTVHMDQPPPPDLRVKGLVDLQDPLEEFVVLGGRQPRDPDRLVPRELAVHLLKLCRRLHEGLGQGLTVRGDVPLREADVLGPHPPLLEAVEQGAGPVVAGDHLERDQKVPRLRGQLRVGRDHLDPPDPHPVGARHPREMGTDPDPPDDREPVGGRPAHALPLVRDEGRG